MSKDSKRRSHRVFNRNFNATFERGDRKPMDYDIPQLHQPLIFEHIIFESTSAVVDRHRPIAMAMSDQELQRTWDRLCCEEKHVEGIAYYEEILIRRSLQCHTYH